MRFLVRFEARKLLHDRQLQLAVLLIVADLIYVYFFFTDPGVSGSTFSSWLRSGTSDTAFLLYFLGLSTVSVFSGDYAYRTYQNFIPYNEMRVIWKAKVAVNLASLLILLLFWYAVAVAFSAARSGYCAIDDLGPLFLRMATQYPHLAFNGGIIALVSVISRSRGVATVALVLSWIAYGFAPIAGEPFYAYVSHSIAWRAYPNAVLVACFACAALVLYFVSGLIAERRGELF